MFRTPDSTGGGVGGGMMAAKTYFHGFDLLRAAGIAAVIWIHGCDTNATALQWSNYTRFAVPIFILISFFLFQRAIISQPDVSAGSFLASRLKRLLPAYLVWSLAYMMVRIAKHHVLHSDEAPSDWVSVIFFGGASYQLYFIAALIYWSLLFLPLMRKSARQPERWVAWSLGFTILGLLLLLLGPLLNRHVSITAEYSMIRHAFGLTGFVPMGVAAALLWHSKPPWLPLSPRRWWVMFFFMSSVALFAIAPTWRIAVSLSLFLWALHYQGIPMPRPIRSLSDLSFGIFMVHGFFVEGLQWVWPRLGGSLHDLFATVAVITLSFVFSYLTCKLIVAFQSLRWLVR